MSKVRAAMWDEFEDVDCKLESVCVEYQTQRQ